jgi:hypothetical protein
MASFPPELPHIGDSHAALEQLLIDDYLQAHGHTAEALRRRNDPEAHALLRAAATYAATKLTEVESRAHYLHELHESAQRR